MFCPKCGAKITEKMNFCVNCGFKITDDIKKEKKETNTLANNIHLKKETEKIKLENNGVAPNTDVTDKSSITTKEKTKVTNVWSLLSMSKKVITIGVAVIILILVIAFAFLISSEHRKAEKINWSELIMGEVIPEPASNLGEIYSNSDDYLSIEILKLSSEQYKDYVDACKEKGFTVDSDQSDTLYSAYNGEGYNLKLYYYDSKNKLNISLNAPIKMSKIVWPTSEYGKMLPIPKSSLGKIEKDDKTGFTVYIGETSIDDYNEYVSACFEKGFTVDSRKIEKSYDAKNADGYALTVEYIGNNIMLISMKEPEFDVEIKVECRENLMFSEYNVKFYIDDGFIGDIKYGATETYNENLKKGTHTLKFVSVEEEKVSGEVTVDITKDEKLELKISCYSDKIDIDVVSGSVKNENNDKDTQKTSNPKETTSTPKEAELETLTVDNCPELAAMLSNKADIDDSYSDFAIKYNKRVIEFDGRIDYCTRHKNYKTRFDYLVSAGDYDPNSQIGPAFKFENVNYTDLNTNLDTVSVGLNVHIVAKVVSFDSNSGLFYLEPISVKGR